MANSPITPEIDVLLAIIDWFMKRGIRPYQFSPPKGAGIDSGLVHSQIYSEVAKWIVAGQDIRPLNFSSDGPDVCGISEKEWWQVECKGVGKGVPPTQRENFARALASVVSYYEEKPTNLPQKYLHYRDARPYLGLAIPASPTYLSELKRRVRQPLRIRLNLWILLYEAESKNIKAISPEDEY
jgi:hypothetical protein